MRLRDSKYCKRNIKNAGCTLNIRLCMLIEGNNCKGKTHRFIKIILQKVCDHDFLFIYFFNYFTVLRVFRMCV